ncbi:hypothetical protein C2U55_05590 [Enterobacteriaceae bacterium ENNIH3]|nr:hypothetical protein C2U55_05590 [Enterobacteriaceae bacterium ENNIH3]AUV06104.1 hypothetical protein C2U52_07370 [Enterobacteriaceae bacterium ENNIH2]PWF52759.1 hypothetical protein BHT19_0018380 [[Kluyvera] intestini]
MFAVVPCQWRRIIGSSQEVTSPNFKKLFNRLFFAQKVIKARVFRASRSHSAVRRAIKEQFLA